MYEYKIINHLSIGEYKPSRFSLFKISCLIYFLHAINILRSSIEVIENGVYSEGSDVWAFGMLVWQMFTLMDIDKKKEEIRTSSVPYDFLSNEQVSVGIVNRGNPG